MHSCYSCYSHTKNSDPEKTNIDIWLEIWTSEVTSSQRHRLSTLGSFIFLKEETTQSSEVKEVKGKRFTITAANQSEELNPSIQTQNIKNTLWSRSWQSAVNTTVKLISVQIKHLPVTSTFLESQINEDNILKDKRQTAYCRHTFWLFIEKVTKSFSQVQNNFTLFKSISCVVIVNIKTCSAEVQWSSLSLVPQSAWSLRVVTPSEHSYTPLVQWTQRESRRCSC